MRVAVFLVFLSLLMLRGYDSIYAGTHHISLSRTPVQFLEHKQHFTATALTSLEEQEEFLISDDIEEEDANNFLARKYKVLDNCYIALSYVFSLSYLCKRFKAHQFLWAHLSDIYITQNVLRI
jgi:hypothetical protein